MTRTNLFMNNIREVRTPNGGRITANNAMSRESCKAQRTATWTTVTVVTNDGREYQAKKKDIQKATAKKILHNFIDRF